MHLTDFFAAVEQHQDLEGTAIDHEKQEFIVQHLPTKHFTRVHANAIKENDWEVIEEILTLQREPMALHHITRVVGYFSRIENWSKSKLGELKDRVQGDYTCGTDGRENASVTLAVIDSVALAQEGVTDELLERAG